MNISSSEAVVIAVLVLVGAGVIAGFYFVNNSQPVTVPAVSQPVSPSETDTTSVTPPVKKAVSPKDVLMGPKIEFSTSEVSFGTIDPYKLRKADITVRNDGDETLVIDHLRASCGCTTPSIDQKSIKPGDETVLHLELNPQHYGGPAPRIFVMVKSNDSIRPVSRINLSADITPEYTIDPKIIDFGRVPSGSTPEQVIHVDQKLDETLQIEKIEKTADGVETSLKEIAPDEKTGHKRYEIHVRVKPDTEPGPLAGEIGIFTNIKRISVDSVVVKGEVYGIETVPSIVHFGLVSPGKKQVATVLVTGPYDFRITEAAIDVDGFKIESATGNKPNEYVLRILMTDQVGTGAKHGAIKIVTRGMIRNRVILIPFHGLVFDARQENIK